MTLRIRNWSKFQHFKDRRPPWVKLYRDLLDDRDWHTLDGPAAKVLTMLWLLASEDETGEGVLPDVETIAFRLRLPERSVTGCIERLSKWLILDDISAISPRYQDGPPETETETETEREAEGSPPPAGGAHATVAEDGNGAAPPCPLKWIQSSYNDLAAEVGLPLCRAMTETRRKHIAARWREYPDRESWENFWTYVKGQPFLHGQNDRGWRADLEWLMKPTNWAKVIEENYVR